MGRSWALLGVLGVALRGSWVALGRSWRFLGELSGPLEAHLGLLGASWELSWGLLGPSWGLLGAPLLGDMNWVDFGTLFRSQKGSQKAPKIEAKSHQKRSQF